METRLLVLEEKLRPRKNIRLEDLNAPLRSVYLKLRVERQLMKRFLELVGQGPFFQMPNFSKQTNLVKLFRQSNSWEFNGSQLLHNF